jgi:hypothetical protein
VLQHDEGVFERGELDLRAQRTIGLEVGGPDIEFVEPAFRSRQRSRRLHERTNARAETAQRIDGWVELDLVGTEECGSGFGGGHGVFAYLGRERARILCQIGRRSQARCQLFVGNAGGA